MGWAVTGIGYWPISASPTSNAVELPSILDGRFLAELLARTLVDMDIGARGASGAAVCSTILSPRLFHSRADASSAMRLLEGVYRMKPCVWFSAYQCTSWVRALEAMHSLDLQSMVMTVLDIEMDGLGHIDRDFIYGRGRQGILHVTLEKTSSGRCDSGLAVVPAGVHPVLSFARSLNTVLQERPVPLLGPFFPQSVQTSFARALAGHSVAPTLYNRYLHCFGADPWINLAHYIAARRVLSDPTVVLGSLALIGYVGFWRLRVSTDFRLFNFSYARGEFEGLDGEAGCEATAAGRGQFHRHS